MFEKKYVERLQELYEKELVKWQELAGKEKEIRASYQALTAKAESKSHKDYLAELLKKELTELGDKKKARAQLANETFGELLAEYNAFMDEKYLPKGEDLDVATVNLLTSGIHLTDGEVSALISRYEDNPTMARLVSERTHADERKGLSVKARLIFAGARDGGKVEREDFKHLVDIARWSASGTGMRQPEDVRQELAQASGAAEE